MSISQDDYHSGLHEDIKGKTLTWVLNPIKEESDIEEFGPVFSSLFPEGPFF